MPNNKTPVLNRAELAAGIAPILGMPETQARDAIDAIFLAMEAALAKGVRVEIRGFGTWAVKPTKPRIGRNIKTGAVVPVPAGFKVSFKYRGQKPTGLDRSEKREARSEK